MTKITALILLIAMQGVSGAVTSLSGITGEATLPPRSPVITVGYLMQVFFSLLIVGGIIFLTAKYILPKLQVSSKGRIIEVIDRIGLEPQISAYILRVRQKSWLLVASNKNVEVIGEIEEEKEA